MKIASANRPSAPECQLSKMGNSISYDILLKGAQALSNAELASLEDDLDYYSRTGLIGVTMSRLLVLLQPQRRSVAA